VDGDRLLVVDGGGGRAGRHLASDTNPDAFAGLYAIQRLTAWAEAAEDTENTAVFIIPK
jgi:hypothetical protein